MEDFQEYGLVKDHFKDEAKNDLPYKYKTHVQLKNAKGEYEDRGITGWYTAKELVDFYPDCECAQEWYEKDDGADYYGRTIYYSSTYIIIYADKDYHNEIMERRTK